VRAAKPPNLWGWIVLLAFFGGFGWLCNDRFHMVSPGYYVILSLAASAALIVIMWRLNVGRLPDPHPHIDSSPDAGDPL